MNLDNIEIELNDVAFDNFDFDVSMFDVSNDLFIDNFESRYLKSTLNKEIKEKHLKSSDAYKLAESIDINEFNRFYVVVSGSFIFGDFLEALLVKYGGVCKNLTITTLSLSEHNIDSLAGLLDAGYIENLNLILSHYFYSHEKNNLIPYIYESLDIDNKFQLAVCATHCKTICIESSNGRYYVIHGSANLRSSQNLEQFIIEESKELYDFNMEYTNRIIEKYKTIDKKIWGKYL